VQRGFYYAIAIVFLLAAVHGTGTLAYAVAGLVLALGGAGVAARQVWLQHLPAAQVPACGPDLFYMLENFPARTHDRKALHRLGPVRGR
jgi:disulfide bond formation protein DsbB